jgi:hypothetical protein
MIEPTNWVKRKLIRIVANLTPHCHDVTRLLSKSMECPLPLRTRLLLRLHFSICVWCRRYGQHLKSLRKFSSEYPEKGCESGQAVLSPDTRDRLNRALRQVDR